MFILTVNSAPALSVSAVSTDVTCNGSSDGAIDVTAVGTGLVYNWSNGSTTEDLSALPGGTYTLTVADVNDCIATLSETILEPGVLNANISSLSNVLCNGENTGEASLSVYGGVPPYSYLWSNGNTTDIISGLSAGTYDVTISDANLCNTTTSALIVEPGLLTVNALMLNYVTCNGLSDGSIAVIGNGGTGTYSYLWSNGQTNDSIYNLSASTYTVTVTDDNNCSSSSEIEMLEPGPITLQVQSVTNVNCYGGNDGSALISAYGGSGSYTYLWDNGETATIVTGLSADSYVVTVTDDNACSAQGIVTIGEPQQLEVQLTPTYVTCNGGNNGGIVASVTGGSGVFSYLWSNGSAQAVQTNLSQGEYFVTVTDENGCEAYNSSVIYEPAPIDISFSVSDALCNGADNGNVSATATGGTSPYSYLWSDGSYIGNLSNISAGLYSLTITDSHSCTASAEVTVGEPDPLELTQTIVNPSCSQSGDGEIDISVLGGTMPYSYYWSTGETSEDIYSLDSGLYGVSVTDINGCELMQSIVLDILYNTSIFGYVLDNGIALGDSAARVELYSELASSSAAYQLIASVPVDFDGSYLFTNLPADPTYYLKAIVLDDINYPDIMTTYYDTSYAYIDATPINLVCDQQLAIDIEMLNMPAQNTGGAYVEGVITYNDAPGSKAVGDPVPCAEVYIEQ
ncbi:MAG: hypothetical protein C0594_05970, partial [Marinilabiliales bacterium]